MRLPCATHNPTDHFIHEKNLVKEPFGKMRSKSLEHKKGQKCVGDANLKMDINNLRP